MSNPSPTDTPLNGSVEAAHEWLHRNGNNVAGIEQKLNGGDTEGFAARKMVIKRKIKKKDDGPLEIVCSWVVENQIGKNLTIEIGGGVSNRCFRTLCQPTDAAGNDPPVFPSGQKTHAEIL